MSGRQEAFTMIELIFVIVIIGILAAVALPKLAVTRDDAKISIMIDNVRIALGDLNVAYMALGQTVFKTKTVKDVTSVPFDTTCGTMVSDTINITGATLRLCDGATECVKFVVDENGTMVSITATATATSDVCVGVQGDRAMEGIAGFVSGTAISHRLGGERIIR